MLTHLFYLTAVLFIYREILWIISPLEQTQDIKKWNVQYKLNKGKSWNSYSKEYKEMIKGKSTVIITCLWLVIGLFSAQWFIFLSILLFNIIIIAPISKLTKYSFMYTVIHWLNSIIGLAFGIFVIINHYHLHIDTYSLFNNYIK